MQAKALVLIWRICLYLISELRIVCKIISSVFLENEKYELSIPFCRASLSTPFRMGGGEIYCYKQVPIVQSLSRINTLEFLQDIE